MFEEVALLKNPERRNYYRFLYHLVKWRRPKIALEIGVEAGLGSTYMAMAAREYDGMVIGIDLHKPSFYPRENYYFIAGDSANMSTFNKVLSMTQKFGKIGVVYQDSSHHYEASKTEWDLYSKLLDKNAVWVCDDILPAFHDPLIDPPGKGMVQYFQELPGDKRLVSNLLHYGNTQGILLTNGNI